MTIVAWVATALLAMAMMLGIVRVITASDGATRAVVGDLIFFSCIGILLIQGMLNKSSVAVDAAMIASVLGIIATIALARILTRGRR